MTDVIKRAVDGANGRNTMKQAFFDEAARLAMDKMKAELAAVTAERDELRAELQGCVDILVSLAGEDDSRATGLDAVIMEKHVLPARAILARTAPNPNAGIQQVAPKGRWTPQEAEAEGLKILKEGK